MGVGPAASVWVPGVRPLAQTKPWSGKGQRPLLRLRRDGERKPVSVKELALNLPGQAWRIVEWREGSNEGLNGRFARVRVPCGSSRQSALRTAPRGVAGYRMVRGRSRTDQILALDSATRHPFR